MLGLDDARRSHIQNLKLLLQILDGIYSLFRRNAKPALYCGRQVISTRTGISFLTGIVSSDGGSILKSERVAGIVPDI